jgi:hypothetical protein
MDTAALMRSLDLIMTADTALDHLAGALGVPVWVALPFAPEWRWLLQREDSPWYPTMRLFRQTEPGQWQGVFESTARWGRCSQRVVELPDEGGSFDLLAACLAASYTFPAVRQRVLTLINGRRKKSSK